MKGELFVGATAIFAQWPTAPGTPRTGVTAVHRTTTFQTERWTVQLGTDGERALLEQTIARLQITPGHTVTTEFRTFQHLRTALALVVRLLVQHAVLETLAQDGQDFIVDHPANRVKIYYSLSGYSPSNEYSPAGFARAMGNASNPKQYTKYSKNTAEVRVKKCIPVQRGMFRLGSGNLFYLILIKIFTILNNIVNKCL
uniref:Uncharacterized protein n=1 Tax=Anopheles culicifacies TaxID=139723 RepID=A0A182LXT6_9DIPT